MLVRVAKTHSRHGVRSPVPLAGHELEARLGDGAVLAVRAEEAERIVDRACKAGKGAWLG